MNEPQAVGTTAGPLALERDGKALILVRAGDQIRDINEFQDLVRKLPDVWRGNVGTLVSRSRHWSFGGINNGQGAPRRALVAP